MRRNTIPVKSYLWIVFLALLGFSSCKTTRVLTRPTVELKPITTNKLIRNIENNAFDYKHLSIKKISCQFDNGKSKNSFRASIQAEKDKQILVMLTKLNIPVARVWLTPDSVKLINYLEDNYLLDNYSYLSSMLGMDIDFQTVNAIISNNIFALGDENRDKDLREFETTIDSGMYVLQSVKKLKPLKNNRKIRERKAERRAKKLVEDAPVKQSLYVDPVSFKIRKIKLEDAVNARNLTIEFSEFADFDKQLYPGEIYLHLQSEENNIQLRIKMSNFSDEKEKPVRFKVPDKFTRINSN